MKRPKDVLPLLCALVCATPAVLAAPVSFSVHNGSCGELCGGAPAYLHADMNNDGREDLIFAYHPIMGDNGLFAIQFANADSTYTAAVTYQVPQGTNGNFISGIATGDFNNDGSRDVAIFATDSKVYVYLNNGKGGLHLSGSFAYSGGPYANAIAGDFNHDSLADIAYVATGGLHILFGNGKGGFTTGPVTAVNGGSPLLGDFDGDGNADIALQDTAKLNTEYVLYGDGTGHFLKTTTLTVANAANFTVGDANSDGRMDVLAAQFGARNLTIFYGNTARTFTTRTTVQMKRCLFGGVSVADLDGNGINDLVAPDGTCTSTPAYGQNNYVDVLTRNSNGSYNAAQTIYTSQPVGGALYTIGSTPLVLRADRNPKPDLLVQQCIDNECAGDTPITFLNTTTGNFPTCAPPNASSGINLCSPSLTTAVASPVSFQAGAAGNVIQRDVELWVDGKKAAEQLDGFSNYTFLNHSLSLTPGSHKVSIFAAGWDQSLQKKSFTLNVK